MKLCYPFILSVAVICSAQNQCTISGRIVDKQSKQSLPNTIVLLEGTTFGTCANSEGYFELTAIPEGTYVIIVSMAGYQKIRREIILKSDKKQNLFFQLAEEAYQYNPVTVTATRERSTVSDVPSSVEVVKLDNIKLPTVTSISDVIQSVPGLFNKDYGGIGNIKTVSIRGSTSSQVLILLDGQRLNTAQSGEVDLSSIPVAGIERIEVVRGSASALYGADAVGGIVNIITKRKAYQQSFNANINTVTGSFGTKGLEVGGNYSNEKSYSMFNYKYLASEGDYEYLDSYGVTKKRINADAFSHSIFGKGIWYFGEESLTKTLSISSQAFLSEAGNPGTADIPNAVGRRKSKNITLNAIYDQKLFTPYNGIQVQTYFHNLEFNYDDPSAIVPAHTYNHNVAEGIELQGKVVIADWHTLTLGYGYRRDDIYSNNLFSGRFRNTHSVYGQLELNPPFNLEPYTRRIVAVPALRWDDFSDFGGEVTPKIGFVVSSGNEWIISLKTNYGKSFRAPSFNDLFWPKDPFTVGNPNLNSESGEDFDIGTMLRYPRVLGLALDVTYFHNKIKDMIIWLSGANGIWSPENVGKAELKGIEMKFGLTPFPNILHLEYNFTFLEALNKNENATEFNKTLPHRPRSAHSATVSVTYENAFLNILYAFNGKRYTTFSNTISLPSYHTLDVSSGYDAEFKGITFGLKCEVKNIENNLYQVIAGYPMPGREFRFSIDLKYEDIFDSP